MAPAKLVTLKVCFGVNVLMSFWPTSKLSSILFYTKLKINMHHGFVEQYIWQKIKKAQWKWKFLRKEELDIGSAMDKKAPNTSVCMLDIYLYLPSGITD